MVALKHGGEDGGRRAGQQKQERRGGIETCQGSSQKARVTSSRNAVVALKPVFSSAPSWTRR